MKTSPNQIRVELKEIAEKHLQTNSFYWGDLLDAVKQDAIDYPLVNCYYPNGSFQYNTTTIQLVVQVSDKLYKDNSNLHDIESDTLQTLRDIFNVINKSPRWKRIGKIQNATVDKFKDITGDELVVHSMNLNFILRDVSGVCDLPILDYDYDQDIPSGGCPDARVINSNLTFDEAVAAGSILNLPDITYNITNSEGTAIITGSEVAQANVSEVLPDINFTDSNGVTTQEPSGKDLVCTPVLQPQTTAMLMKTGDPNDGGAGRNLDPFTLDSIPLDINGNTFLSSNTDRFCDELGTQSYTGGIVVDRATFEPLTGRVLCYPINITLTGNVNQDTAESACSSFSTGTFTTGWRLWNYNEAANMRISGGVSHFWFAPWNNITPLQYWTSTKATVTSSTGFVFSAAFGNVIQALLIGNSGRALPVRTAVWNGTILT
jgi:hypothetical protein